jgi:predicted DsbA family dithiol-disulfide isomerase
VYARVTAVGAQHGIAFDFDRIVRQPNTLVAHTLLAKAGERDAALQSNVKEALMRAFFLEHRDLTDRETLLDVVALAGLDRGVGQHALDDPELREHVAQDEARARAIGIQGVPFFIFDGRLAVSGAQGTAALVEAMRQAEAVAA